ncbi:helix-turn-helix domain-containing protein [Amycolatopsis pigmentata]|uniref:Helix-turn-helix domain-containing protein n=1 Tax=Amycolatopsis pigmentata TaxID=450801 RepID=A0ABW5G6C9_9PSEU
MTAPERVPEHVKAVMATLRAIRTNNGITQAEIANRIGCQNPHISRIEKGHGNPSLGTFLRYLRALNLRLAITSDEPAATHRTTPGTTATAGHARAGTATPSSH